MTATLPPWLDINPTKNLIASAQLGSSMGESARRQGDEEMQFGQKLQADLTSKANDLQLRQKDQQFRVQQAAEAHKMATANLQMETQRAQAGVAEAGQRLQTESQKAQVQEAESKMKMNMAWEAASKKYQAQQTYQQNYQKLIDSGANPDDAARQAAFQSPWAVGGTGESWMWTRPKATVPAKMDAFDAAQLKADYAGLSSIQKQTAAMAAMPNAKTGRALLNQRDTINQDIAKLQKKYQTTTGGAGGGGSSAVPSQEAIDYLKANPDLAADFDAKYGDGLSKQILSGSDGAEGTDATEE